MTNREDMKQMLIDAAAKVNLAKLERLTQLIPELDHLDELLGHNAETARDQLKNRADAILSKLPASARPEVVDLLARVNADAVQIGLRMTDFAVPQKVLLFMHIDDFLAGSGDIPVLQPEVPARMQQFLRSNPGAHLAVLSHDTADVTALLTTALAGPAAIDQGQVSMVYESGLGLYLGSSPKQKKDHTAGMRSELTHALERLAVAAATHGSSHFKDRFYFSATEYSLGIRVHSYARSLSKDLDKEAAHELVKALATALSDMVKEDVRAIESHIINYFLSQDPSLQSVFSPSHDERVWDMERVDQLLQMFRFVHLGARGSLIRPADASDVQAAETIQEMVGKDRMIIVCSDSPFSMPLLEWGIKQQHRFIACSDGAAQKIRDMVETRGGIEYAAGHIEELLDVVDAYLHLKPIVS